MTRDDALPLVEWWMLTSERVVAADAVADVAIFDDGRVRFGPRLGRGQVRWHRLSPGELASLRRAVFEDGGILDIETETLLAAVGGAAMRRHLATASSGTVATGVPSLDAGTTVLRVAAAGEVHEVRYYDLAGDTHRYSGVDSLQRVRRVELRILGLIDALLPSAR